MSSVTPDAFGNTFLLELSDSLVPQALPPAVGKNLEHCQVVLTVLPKG